MKIEQRLTHLFVCKEMYAVLERPLNNKKMRPFRIAYVTSRNIDHLQLLFHLLDVLYCVPASRLEMIHLSINVWLHRVGSGKK
jgi:hypothetical protein